MKVISKMENTMETNEIFFEENAMQSKNIYDTSSICSGV